MISEKKLSTEQYQQKMEQRKKIQEQRLVEASKKKGLIIINTGHGKGKTTAALGMVLRSLGHGFQVAIIQFVKGAWEPAEKSIFKSFGKQIEFYAMGEGFTWETQDRERDIFKAKEAWEKSLSYINNSDYQLILLDEINIALKLGYLESSVVIKALKNKPKNTHVILTGRNALPEIIEIADMVTEMNLIKHPFKEQKIKAQAGIEF
ncbi:cob(I)yrinic acid a,c-diamide adenosyltransferase [Candidatus Atelocyanobacterium thalassae]|jgi:cob(I)alamin adenosyltransferase|uniref:Cob(I)yrinic acid a,c-diamide adenosyltransferase n=1 Tax=Atelocyanobacterium thalassa (isolate ALOHA) TaxID=1453429 RepID=D3ENQ3_ATETH|nr:cob(I)yrinic acid a,c-diamide adenosyltransferase [Candidatus Atelocyanobacterium thalassa]ADB95103.1 cob(I)yrinic acid a,c-diamide adenosyltransferase [Candidatus Atelocyanobacterium thalassa isolate ALOHA]MCH2544070.1 cob(I)yrinic acid a,c-diamide adenosyltransferase [Candidatus Atelocyanobacterium sp. ALOHA_A2.5_9]|tara:strand:- start:558 stop:1175 length:618 start_codon:yes stop_codon:yes gene_type:complete